MIGHIAIDYDVMSRADEFNLRDVVKNIPFDEQTITRGWDSESVRNFYKKHGGRLLGSRLSLIHNENK